MSIIGGEGGVKGKRQGADNSGRTQRFSASARRDFGRRAVYRAHQIKKRGDDHEQATADHDDAPKGCGSALGVKERALRQTVGLCDDAKNTITEGGDGDCDPRIARGQREGLL